MNTHAPLFHKYFQITICNLILFSTSSIGNTNDKIIAGNSPAELTDRKETGKCISTVLLTQ